MKKWWKSKTLWVNVIAIAGIIIHDVAGFDILTPENQAAALGIVNIILRSVTKGPVAWK